MASLAKKDLKEIRALTQVNDCGAAYQLVAKALGCAALADQFGQINRRQLELGHLPHELYEARHRLYQELMAQARALLEDAEYRQLYRSL